jgi:nucleotide-binding universal stress UspA family protein
LDGSELAEQALPCARMLASALLAELVLFRAVSLPADVRAVLADAEVDTETPLDGLEAQAQEYLEQVADGLENTGFSVQRVVRQGPPAESIIDYAKDREIQHIVMATHGYGGISRWVHGSVAERVLQSANVPVLTVRAGVTRPETAEQTMSCSRILVPLDGSSIAEQVLPPVISIAQALDAQVVLFRVPLVSTSGSLTGDWYLPLEGVLETAEHDVLVYLESVARRLRECGVGASSGIQVGTVADSIVDYAETNRIDLIAMCTHGRTGLARWALGSVADRALRAVRVPILLVRASP